MHVGDGESFAARSALAGSTAGAGGCYKSTGSGAASAFGSGATGRRGSKSAASLTFKPEVESTSPHDDPACAVDGDTASGHAGSAGDGGSFSCSGGFRIGRARPKRPLLVAATAKLTNRFAALQVDVAHDSSGRCGEGDSEEERATEQDTAVVEEEPSESKGSLAGQRSGSGKAVPKNKQKRTARIACQGVEEISPVGHVTTKWTTGPDSPGGQKKRQLATSAKKNKGAIQSAPSENRPRRSALKSANAVQTPAVCETVDAKQGDSGADAALRFISGNDDSSESLPAKANDEQVATRPAVLDDTDNPMPASTQPSEIHQVNAAPPPPSPPSTSPPAKKRGKSAKLPPSTAGAPEAPAQSADAPTDKPDTRQLSSEQASSLALLAARLNEVAIAKHLRGGAHGRRIVVATPINPSGCKGTDVLPVDLGAVVHCEATDGTGWGFGTVLSPPRLAGQRGCFRCDDLRPVVVEVRQCIGGETLDWMQGDWTDVPRPQATTTQQRLCQKAICNRMRVARAAWETRDGAG